jgi:hypothetical protein
MLDIHLVFLSSSLLPLILVGFSRQNEWHNVFPVIINGLKWWVSNGILLLFYLGFLHFFGFTP